MLSFLSVSLSRRLLSCPCVMLNTQSILTLYASAHGKSGTEHSFKTLQAVSQARSLPRHKGFVIGMLQNLIIPKKAHV